MANRDKSQGFAFAYVDVAQMLKDAKEGIIPPIQQGKNVVNIPRPKQSPQSSISRPQETPTQIKPQDKKAEKAIAVEEVKQNLDRLQNLHHKLHIILEELNQMTKWNKKGKK